MNKRLEIMKKIILAALSLGLFSGQMASAQQMPPIPVDPQVRVGHLDNGLTYYIRHNEEPKDQVNFYIAQKVGSILEEEPQRGLAHFLEHMCFNGTEKFPGNGLIKYLESIGVKFGADLNAYTSIDETVYNIDNVPVTAPGAVDSCLWILHDWADGLLLTDEDIDHERGVIHEEWRTRRNASIRMMEAAFPILYPGNRYAERMPIGLVEVIDNFPYQAIRDYYEKWYRPDLQGIVIVGDVDVDQIEAKVKDIFGTIAAPVDPAERVYFPVEDNQEPIIAMVKDKEQPYALSMIFCKHDAYPDEMKGDLNYFVYDYAVSMIQLMMANRINEMKELPEPPFVDAQVVDDDYYIAKTKGAFTGAAVTSEAGLVKGVTAVYREMLRAQRNGFTASEYERAKADYLTHVESAYNDRAKIKSQQFCKEYVRHFIDNEPIPGIENEYMLANQLAPNIPVEVVNSVMSQLVSDHNLAVMCQLPDKDGVTYPTEAEMLAALKAVEAEDIAAYADEASDEPLMAELPVPGKVVKTQDAKFGYKKLTLSNGATVYIKSTDFKADEILMTVTSEGGTSLYSASEAVTLGEAGDIYDLGGLGNFSSTGLRKALAGKKVRVNPQIGLYSEGFSGASTPKDFETMLQILNLYFTSPRMDEDAFQSYISRSKSTLANQELSPMTAFRDTLVSVLYRNNPRALRVKAEDMDRIDYSRAMKIASERFANAADFSFIFTGSIDEATMIPMIEQYIGSLPSGGRKEKRRNVGMNVTKGEIENVFEKEMEVAKATSFMVESGKMKNDLKSNMTLDFVSQILNIIYTEEIREKEGGTYGVQVGAQISSFPKPNALLQIVYETDPDKCAYLNGRIMDILKDFAANGPSEENVAKIREYKTKKHLENLKENSYYANLLENWLETGKDYFADYDAILAGITAEDVRAALAGLLRQGNHISIVMSGVAK